MIFVTVGTVSYEDLVKKMDEIAPDLKEKVVVQIGGGKYTPKNCKWFRYAPSLDKHYSKARLVVTHGGAATLFECLHAGLRVVAIPKEITKDSHQKDVVDELEKDNYIIVCRNLDDLKKCIQSRKKLKEYVRPRCEIGERIIEFLAGR